MDLTNCTLVELRQMAKEKGIKNVTKLKKDELIEILDSNSKNADLTKQNNNLNEKTLSEVRKLLANKKISYIFLKDDEKENDTIKKLKESYEFTTVKLNTISTLSASDRKDKKDYISIMEDNINSIKLEVNN